MKLPEYVKPYPRLLNPFNAKGGRPFFMNRIWLRKDIYDDLLSDKPSPWSVSILIHEEEHRKSVGIIKSFEYLFSPKSRIEEEMSAYKIQFAYLKKHRGKWDIDHTARAFSGPVYYWSMSEGEAKKMLEKAWREA